MQQTSRNPAEAGSPLSLRAGPCDRRLWLDPRYGLVRSKSSRRWQATTGQRGHQGVPGAHHRQWSVKLQRQARGGFGADPVTGEDLTHYRAFSRKIWRLVKSICGGNVEKLGMDECQCSPSRPRTCI